MALLDVNGLEIFYGDLQAVFDMNFTVADGEAVALVGANGAGKSTFLKALVGLNEERRGAVHFDGNDISQMPAEEVSRLGLIMVPEGRLLFDSLTIEENLLMGTVNRRKGSWTLRRVFDLFPILEERRRMFPGQLSGGQQQPGCPGVRCSRHDGGFRARGYPSGQVSLPPLSASQRAAATPLRHGNRTHLGLAMVGKRRSQCGGNHPGWSGWGGLLGAGFVAMTLACTSERNLFAPDTIQAGATGSGTAALVGEWRTVLWMDVGTDVQTWTTTWRFQEDGVCLMTRAVRHSTLEDITRTTVRPCQWTAANAVITVTYDDGTTSLLSFSFYRLDRNRLLLEGIEYARLGTG